MIPGTRGIEEERRTSKKIFTCGFLLPVFNRIHIRTELPRDWVTAAITYQLSFLIVGSLPWGVDSDSFTPSDIPGARDKDTRMWKNYKSWHLNKNDFKNGQEPLNTLGYGWCYLACAHTCMKNVRKYHVCRMLVIFWYQILYTMPKEICTHVKNCHHRFLDCTLFSITLIACASVCVLNC